MPVKTPKVPSTTEAILRLPLLDENNKLLSLGNTPGKFQFPETTELEAVTGAKKYRDFASRA